MRTTETNAVELTATGDSWGCGSIRKTTASLLWTARFPGETPRFGFWSFEPAKSGHRPCLLDVGSCWGNEDRRRTAEDERSVM
jgi:hypothetical protein